ncbi:MAG: alpha-amylase family glycosyl hydrolase [Roseburia sp.]
MGYTYTEGNYEKFGLQFSGNTAVFTFAGEKEDECRILLYGKNHEVVERIDVPREYCRGSVRSIRIEGLSTHDLKYNYEINGKVSTDVYARRIVGREKWADTARAEYDFAVCGGVMGESFDWRDDAAPEVPRNRMVMYKLHVRGFSMDAGLRGKKKGTFAAVTEKIPYLKKLGVTTVEFMPVYEFEELVFEKKEELPEYVKWEPKEGDRYLPKEEKETIRCINYWGYTTGNYFAVKASYASGDNAAAEWKELIRTLHENGMECVMELFFDGHMNQNVILDVLRYWVSEFHVDGFHLLGDSIPVTAIAQDLLLSRTKIFYVGFEPFLLEQRQRYPHLYVYSDEYLYPIRKILNHTGGRLEEFVNQQRKQHPVKGFVNYITNNNGFTLYDLFSYSEKHNEANGEENADGNNYNFSSNCGLEGRTTRRFVTLLREQQMRNAFAVLLLAQGVPLLLAGDEFANSQNGNNNAYCQDNRIGWLNWKNEEKYAWLTEYVGHLTAFRRNHPFLAADSPMRFSDYKNVGFPDLSYHGEKAWISSFSLDKQAVGMFYCGEYGVKEDGTPEDDVYIGYNFHHMWCGLALPKLSEKKKWHLVMDTSRGHASFPEKVECLKNQQILSMEAQSVVILIGK